MSSACSQALGLPEIVAAIMEQLHRKKSLFGALQVNRLWADEATVVLWRMNPPIQGLIQISNVERRQHYANKISSLQIHGLSKVNHLLNTRFSRLTKLFTSFPYEGDQQYLDRVLQPNLQSFSYSGSQLRFESLLQIATRCPHLLFLSLDWWQHPFGTRDLIWFLDLMPSLTHISLDFVGKVEQYVHLASRPNLQGLHIFYSTLTEDATMRVLATVTNPYPKLRYLSWSATGKAFGCLARHLCNLCVLDLALVDASDDILFAISDCTNLERIDVRFRRDSYVPAEGLLAIARKCPHLRVCNLDRPVRGNMKIDGRGITDDIIGQVATYLPTMTCFRLVMETNLTITALLYLGDRCPNLTDCYLKGDFDLEQLCHSNSAPCFPQLKNLELHKISENVPYERAMSILQQKCPQVRVAEWPSPEDWDGRIYVILPGYFRGMYDFGVWNKVD